MNKTIPTIVLFLLCYCFTYSQNSVQGMVVESYSKTPLSNVLIRVKNTIITTKTTTKGVFKIDNLVKGNYILEISFIGFETQNFPIEINL